MLLLPICALAGGAQCSSRWIIASLTASCLFLRSCLNFTVREPESQLQRQTDPDTKAHHLDILWLDRRTIVPAIVNIITQEDLNVLGRPNCWVSKEITKPHENGRSGSVPPLSCSGQAICFLSVCWFFFLKKNDVQLYLHSNSRRITRKLKLFIITRGIFASQLSVLNLGSLKFSFLH